MKVEKKRVSKKPASPVPTPGKAKAKARTKAKTKSTVKLASPQTSPAPPSQAQPTRLRAASPQRSAQATQAKRPVSPKGPPAKPAPNPKPKPPKRAARLATMETPKPSKPSARRTKSTPASKSASPRPSPPGSPAAKPAEPKPKTAAAPTAAPTPTKTKSTKGRPAPTPSTPAAPVPPQSAAPEPPSTAKPSPQPTSRSTPKPTSAPAPAKAARPLPTTGVPAILLEGDASLTTGRSGPGERYALGSTPPAATGRAPAQLPSSYGTGKLLLVARDPHWLYAYWDLTDAQLREYNRKSASGHLVLRIYPGAAPASAEPILSQDVHPESRNWFLHVPHAAAQYVAELGYLDTARRWNLVSRSAATLTPADDLSPELWVRFETLPFDVPLATLVELVKEVAPAHVPLIEAIQRLRETGHPILPTPDAIASQNWTPAQEAALAQLLNLDEVRRVWIGSLEITELLRRQLVRGISSGELPISSLGAVTSLSSPFGGGEGTSAARGFWFNVNAELIVYGSTDPSATVTVGERVIRLRPDGSFSYRFALPDGEFPLPIAATSPDRVETRHADLRFRRVSTYRGEVAKHPQDPNLRPPSPENVA